MIDNEFTKEINIIDENLKKHFSYLNQSKLEDILSRLSKLTEEIWELNSDVLNIYYKRRETKDSNIELEFADVMICLALLAKSVDVDLEKALINKFNIIKQRWWI